MSAFIEFLLSPQTPAIVRVVLIVVIYLTAKRVVRGVMSHLPRHASRRPAPLLLAGTIDARQSLERAKDALADIIDTSEVDARVAAVSPRLNAEDRDRLAGCMEAALAAVQAAFEANGTLTDQPSRYDPDRAASPHQFFEIRDAYDTVCRQAEQAKRNLGEVVTMCELYEAAIADVPLFLTNLSQSMTQAHADYAEFAAAGFRLDLTDLLAEGDRAIETAQRHLDRHEEGIARDVLAQAAAACGRIGRAIEAERKRRTDLKERIAALHVRSAHYSDQAATTASLLDRLTSRYGPSAAQGLATKATLTAAIDKLEVTLGHAEDAVSMDVQNWTAADAAIEEATVLATKFERMVKALTDVATHYDLVFATAPTDIETLHGLATALVLPERARQGLYQARLTSLIANIAGLKLMLAVEFPDYPEISRRLMAYTTELAEIRDGLYPNRKESAPPVHYDL